MSPPQPWARAGALLRAAQPLPGPRAPRLIGRGWKGGVCACLQPPSPRRPAPRGTHSHDTMLR